MNIGKNCRNLKIMQIHKYTKEPVMPRKWMIWSAFESVIRLISSIFQKSVENITATSFGFVLYATLLIGFVQGVAGLIILRCRKKAISSSAVNIIGSIGFGIFGVIAICLSFLVFARGGQLSIHVFITSMSIVPGALIDRFVFKHYLSMRQWSGVLVAVVAAYVMLGMPSFDGVTGLQLWVWFSFGTMIAMAINQGITQHIKDVDPFVKNFWGGTTIFILAGIGLTIFGGNPISSYPYKLTLVSVIIGALSVLLWTVNVLAYKDGASIAIKKLVVNGSYLGVALVVGAMGFGEEVTLYKISALIFFLVGFILLDNPTWKFFRDKCKVGNL